MAGARGETVGDELGAEPVVAGVPLLQYAAVVAALDDELSLEEVLDTEGLDPATWQAAHAGFRVLLCQDPRAFARYGERLAEAQDRLARRVIPLDEDLDAWTTFLAHASAHGTDALLAEHELRLGDLARLERLWGWKLAESTILVRRAGKVRSRLGAALPPLPPIHVGPTLLKASPAARPAAARASGAAGGPPPSGRAELRLTLDDYAGLEAELHVRSTERERVLARHGLDAEAAEQVARAWGAALRRDPALAADFRALRAHHVRQLGYRTEAASSAPASDGRSAPPSWRAPPAVLERRREPQSPEPAGARPGAPAAVLDVTAPAGAAPLVVAWPFAATPEAAPRTRAEPGDVPDGALPFRRPTQAGAVLRIPLREMAVESARAAGRDLDVTSASAPSLLELDPLPFRRGRPPTPPSAPAGSAAQAARRRLADGHGAGTPAHPAPAAQPGAADLDATSDMTPAHVLGLGDALPFRTAAAPHPVAPAPPALTLPQYASLCAELALYPAHAAAVLARYLLRGPHDVRALEVAYATRFARDPASRTEFERVYRQYAAWLTRRR
ncbi:MAG: hypothetical protein IT373_09070 [Polyangiaceae bacterium]|nr:hypothetical protein [Polyangiaceae bacterium]